MLDAIKGLTGGGKAQKQAEELTALIQTAREERSALTAILAQISLRSAQLPETAKMLLQADAKADKVTGSIDALTRAFEELQQQATGLGDVGEAAPGDRGERQSCGGQDGTTGRGGRHAEQHPGTCSSSRRRRSSSGPVEVLKRERASLEEFPHALRQSHWR